MDTPFTDDGIPSSNPIVTRAASLGRCRSVPNQQMARDGRREMVIFT